MFYRKLARTAVWYVLYSLVVVALAMLASTRGSLQLHGIVIGSVSLLFGLVETIFWKLAEPPGDFFAPEVFDTRQAIRLEKAYQGLRPFLTRRFFVSLGLKLIALVASAILLKPEVLAPGSQHLLPFLARLGYFCTLMALPTLVVMWRAYAEVADFNRNVALKTSVKSRSNRFRKKLHAA